MPEPPGKLSVKEKIVHLPGTEPQSSSLLKINYIIILHLRLDIACYLFSFDIFTKMICTCFCGLVVRVPSYRSRGPGSIPGSTRFPEK
jgi:hypothetical protein